MYRSDKNTRRAYVACSGILVLVFGVFYSMSGNAGIGTNERVGATNLIVSFKSDIQNKIATDKASATDITSQLSNRMKVSLQYIRLMSGGSHVMSIPNKDTSEESIKQAIQNLMNDPQIKSVELDAIVRPLKIASDYFYPEQWPLHESTLVPAGLNMPNAWNTTTGSEDIVVAVIDTGILPNHVDLQGRILPGYDFIREFFLGNDPLKEEFPSYLTYFRTNDGDGRDDNASDPGDWIDIDDIWAMSSVGVDCYYQDSSFHGTGIASIIAGNSEHGDGIAGIDWAAKILPVRVSGKCGGSRSDMIDAIRWAAGIFDPALPLNPNPARVINLSLGSNTPCGFSEQAAINDAYNAGVVIVAAAGNQGTDLKLSPMAPAVCNNVITVAALNYEGDRAYYSNMGEAVDIAAPGGESAQSGSLPILVASNNGLKSPIEGSHFKYVAGSSAATAHVSGAISLMLAANPQLTPDEVRYLLTNSARKFVTTGDSPCDTNVCGAGMLDIAAAVSATNDGSLDEFDIESGSANPSQPDDEPATIVTGVSGLGAGTWSYWNLLSLLSLFLIRSPTFRQFY